MAGTRKYCSLCRRRKLGLWFLTTDCKICRAQWRAFYGGTTPVSPLMRTIAAEQVEAVAQSHRMPRKRVHSRS